QKSKPQQAARQKAVSSAAREHGGPQEGIKVHGHWVIEIRNQDGTVVTHREFENALATQGHENLAALLAHAAAGGHWLVTLQGASGACPAKSVSPRTDCLIAESNSLAPFDTPGRGISTNLTVALEGQNLSRVVVLNGSVAALAAGDINSVDT